MEYKLSELVNNIYSGGTPDTRNLSYWNGNIKWLSSGETKKSFIYKTEKSISSMGVENSSTRLAKKGSIVIASAGQGYTRGQVSMIMKDMYINQSLICIDCNLKKISNFFLYYYLKSKYNELRAISDSNSIRGSITTGMIKNLIINIPELEMQEKIGNVLYTLDRKIELNYQINDNLLKLGRMYFDEYINECTEEVSIRDIADEVLDYTKNKNDKVKLLNSSDITENIFPEVEFVENKNLKGHFKKRFKKHDILYSQIRPRNHHYGYVLLEDCEEYLASTRFMVVRNKPDKISSSLLYYYLTSKKAVDDFTAKTESRSGTFPQGNYEDLSSFAVKYSSNQEVITQVLDSILETVNHNNIENNKLSALRDLLLPKLMNGEIDLDKIEI